MTAILALAVALLSQDPIEVQKAMKTLEKSPESTSANLVVGSYLAEKGVWAKAIEHLEKSKNKDISSAIKAEEKVEENAYTLVEIGDAWAKALPKASIARQACFDRMNFFYAKAYEGLDDPWKAKLKEKLYKLYFPKMPGKAFEGRPAGWGGITNQDCGVEVTNKIARDGGSSLRLYAKKPGASIFLQTPVVSVSKGQKVEVSVWVMSDGTEGAGDGLVWSIASSTEKSLWMHREAIKPDLPVWTLVKAEVESPEESFRVRLDIRVTSPKGSVYIDGISVKVNGKEGMARGFE